MSEAKVDRIEIDLLAKATRTTDPEKLEEIARELDKYSLSESAEVVRKHARHCERRLAEQVWR